VVNTYQVWLRYELFRGTLSQDAFEASERNLADFHGWAFKHRRRGPVASELPSHCHLPERCNHVVIHAECAEVLAGASNFLVLPVAAFFVVQRALRLAHKNRVFPRAQ
jgi:hypothetical protein